MGRWFYGRERYLSRPDGNSYEGQWKNNNYHGVGIFKYSNGDVYDGEWINGLRSGEGTLSKINGDIYKGSWSANKKEGIGTYPQKVEKSISVYGLTINEVEMERKLTQMEVNIKVNGKKSYQRLWKNGIWYRWFFMKVNGSDGIKSGKGIYVFEDGSKYDGFWVENREMEKENRILKMIIHMMEIG